MKDKKIPERNFVLQDKVHTLSYSKKRVHIGHFVLVFKIIKRENKIVFMDFDHHDKIYGR